MVEQLFGSKTRVKLLELFYSNPNRQFYVREITRKIDEQINSVRRELANLLNIGIIVSESTDNNRLYYEVNQNFEYYQPLSEIFGNKAVAAGGAAMQTPVGKLDEEFKALGNIEVALYTGQFTRDESSGIDVLLVGNVNQNQVNKYIADLEAQEGKEIRYAVLTPADFEYRRKIRDRFIATVEASKKQVLVDKYNVFG
mgnify:CR=1 FL=1